MEGPLIYVHGSFAIRSAGLPSFVLYRKVHWFIFLDEGKSIAYFQRCCKKRQGGAWSIFNDAMQEGLLVDLPQCYDNREGVSQSI